MISNQQEKMRANRETELQRYYDYATDKIISLNKERHSIVCRLEDIETEFKKAKETIEQCKKRAIEKNCLHIL